jgi:hypothetical protein
MSVTASESGRRTASRAGKAARAFYTSPDSAIVAESAGLVAVNVTIREGHDGDIVQEVARLGGKAGATKAALLAVAAAAERVFERKFAGEIEQVVDAYRLMLRESLAKQEDPALRSALNRARLQERVLASTTMVDQTQACELLGLSTANPSATMKRKEERGELLRFTADGRAAYPFFQFDVEGRRVFPAISRLIDMKPQGWSDFRLLYWLTRPHLDFDSAPEAALGTNEAGVLAAFEREIEPAVHG